MFGHFGKKPVSKPYVIALVVAAGTGSRMRSEVSKQFLLLDGKPVLAHTLERFSTSEDINEIMIVTRGEDILTVHDLVREFEIGKVSAILPGGDTRQESVYCGLSQIQEKDSIVLIHDGARPFAPAGQFPALIEQVQRSGAAALGVAVKDTIKEVDSSSAVIRTVDRTSLRQIQTPQAFYFRDIWEAHCHARESGIRATDDCALAEQAGMRVTVIEGSYANIKITTPEDLWLAEAIRGYIEEEQM